MSQHPTKKLFVKNLPATVTEQKIRAALSAKGHRVRRATLHPPHPRHTLRVATVVFDSIADAAAAAEHFQGSVTAFGGPDPIELSVCMANGPPPDENTAARPPSFETQRAHAVCPENIGKTPGVSTQTLWVSGLPLTVTANEVTRVFSSYGTVVSVWVIPRKPHFPFTMAKVTLESEARSFAALELHKSESVFPGRTLRVEPHYDRALAQQHAKSVGMNMFRQD